MTYMGAKSGAGVYQTIIAQMPPHDCYIEAFLGSGAILRAKPPAARSIAIERDARTLADHPPPAGVEIVNGDAVDILATFDYAAAGRVLVYADPPYLIETRTSRRRYRHDMIEQDHRRLLAELRDLPCAVILSGYPNPLYDALLPPGDGNNGTWRKIEFQAMTRGGPRTECLWLNFPAGAVQWARFAGRNFTDRQRIKRKAARWAANYRKCPPAERLAILAALMAENGPQSGFKPPGGRQT